MSDIKKRSGAESRRLRDLRIYEQVIESARQSFLDMGRALEAIRDERLYGDEFDTFDAYVEDRWEITGRQAYRLITAHRINMILRPIGHKIQSEAAARELVPIAEDEAVLVAVYEEAVRRAAGGRVTAALVAAARDDLAPTVIEGELADDEHSEHAVADAMRAAIKDAERRQLEGFTSPVGGDGPERPAHNEPTKTSGPVDSSPVDGPGEDPTEEDASGTADRDASSTPADAQGVADAGDETGPEAPASDASGPVLEQPKRAGSGVAPPALAPNLVNTPLGPMPQAVVNVLDKHVPDPNPHREWQGRFLASVQAAAKAMRGYSGAEIAEKADDELRAEFARFVGDMESLLHETSQAQIAAANVRHLRRVQ